MGPAPGCRQPAPLGGIPLDFFGDDAFPLELAAERVFTSERIFNFFNVSADNSVVRSSNQIENNVIFMRKGPHLRRWLALQRAAIEYDMRMITDAYNGESRELRPRVFVENRHDQSLASVSRKILGSVVLSTTETNCVWDGGEPEGAAATLFWACRDSN